jgi:nucleoside-diphosphate-sugar epimerase
MLVGGGLIARAFAEFGANPDIKIFASGVSNSLETSRDEFSRERNLLQSEIDGFRGLLVYFGTASIHDPSEASRPYVLHKKAMESLVAGSCRCFLIFRMPQVVGRNAKANTIIEYFHQKILAGEPFEVWGGARRRLIDVDDVAAICRAQIAKRESYNRAFDLVPPVSIGAEEIVVELASILGQSARYSLVDRGGDLELDVTPFVALAKELGMTFGADYPRHVIRKYYDPS